MTTHTIASSFRLCDNAQNDFLLKAYIVLWLIIILATTIWAIHDFVQADSWEKRKKIITDFIKCFPITFILPFPLASVIIAAIIFLLGAGLRIELSR